MNNQTMVYLLIQAVQPHNSHTFLAIWGADLASPAPNITALFCEPAYWVQGVNVTVTVPNITLSNVTPLASPVPLKSDIFNISNYEYVIGTGAMTNTQRFDISRTTRVIDQTLRLQRRRLNYSVTNMVGFALGASRLELPQYLDAGKLVDSFEKAHKLLFALAVQGIFAPGAHIADPRLGIVQGDTNAIVVFRILAITAEALLGLITVFALALLFLSWNCQSQLKKDPASLTDLVELLTPSIIFGGMDQLLAVSIGATAAKSLMEKYSVHGAVLDTGGKDVRKCEELSTRIQDGKLYIAASGCDLEQPVLGRAGTKIMQKTWDGDGGPIDKDPKLFRPVEMTSVVAGIFISVLLIALTILAVLQLEIQKHIGLPLPSDKPVVTNIVLNYLPVVFATFLEPFWVLLNRLLCVLKSFEELRNGEATASASLDLKYTSLPPQLVLFRALRVRHFLLAAVCAISISANVLAVSLSGLFQTNVVSKDFNSTFTAQYLPIFSQSNGTTGSDHIYIAKSNFSDGRALPAWVSRDRFFLPFGLNMNSSIGNVRGYRAITQGFGISVRCSQAEVDSEAYVMNPEKGFIVRPPATGGRSIECKGLHIIFGGQNHSNAALEVLQDVTPIDTNVSQEDRGVCETILVAGFLRANLTVDKDNSKASGQSTDKTSSVLNINTISSLWLTCQPTFLTAPYEVIVDTNNRIQTYTRQAPYSTDLGPYFTNNFSLTDLLRTTSLLMSTVTDTDPFWHNDTFVDTWFGYFVKTLSNSSLPVDPSAPVPAFDTIAPVVEDIYTRLFAIILGLHPGWFPPAPAGATVRGAMVVACTRIFISRTMLIIAVSLISLNVLVAVAYYARRPKRMLAQMPNTIASTAVFFEGSGLVAEKTSESGWNANWKFGYGKFVGTDKKPHLGIERRPFVIPWGDG